MALTGDQHHVVGLGPRHRIGDRRAAVTDLDELRRGRGTRQHGGSDRGRVFVARIVVGDDDQVGQLGGDFAHRCPLTRIAITARTHDDGQAAAALITQRLQDRAQGARLVRVVDHGQERLAALDEAIGAAGQNALSTPWEEVRDFFHYCDNYIDAVDRAAERFACPAGQRTDLWQSAVKTLADKGIRVTLMELPANSVFRRKDNELQVNAAAEAPTRLFQLLHLVAQERQSDLLDATLDLARFRSDTARQIARLGLANYFAGAAMMPYRPFLAAAQAERHDLERLAHLFDASLEQVAHRLSTMQRPGAKGVPFFFVRVDQAGTITKRHSATRLQFARFGGACPLWNVHQAFEQPGRFLRQLAETPDGMRYLLLSRDVSKHAGVFNAPVRRFAIGLGCEVAHAEGLVYADGLDLTKPRAFEPIGISCRICPRPDCHQRSVPPIDRPLRVPPDRNGPLPYEIA